MADFPEIDPGLYAPEDAPLPGVVGGLRAARDTRLDRPVTLREQAPGEPEAHLLAEVRLLARLRHPAIPPVHEAGRWGDTRRLFYATRRLPERSLRQAIDEAPALEHRLALLPAVLAVADAVAHAHEERALHGGLTPERVLLGGHGDVVVVGWGDGAASAHMAPEQARGEQGDERADVYALGALLYHVLAGEPPYRGGPDELLRDIVEAPPTALPGLQRGVPAELLALVEGAMSREPGRRPPAARELAAGLRAFLLAPILAARRASPPSLLLGLARRHRGAALVASAALLGALGTAATGLLRAVEARHSAEAARARAEGERLRAEQQRRAAEEARAEALDHADDLVLVQAQEAVEREPNRAIAWLKSLSPSCRRWGEARLIAAAAQRAGLSVALDGHAAPLNEGVFSPDGGLIATSSDDQSIHLWTHLGAPLLRLEGHADEVQSASFSGDGRMLVSISKDGTLRRWSTESGDGRELGKQPGGFMIRMTSDDRWAISVSADELRLTDVVSGEVHALPSGQGLRSRPAISPDGRWLGALGDGELRLWSLPDGALRTYPGETGKAPASPPWSAFSPDGHAFAAGTADGQVLLWDTQSGRRRALDEHEEHVNAVSFSPDGKLLASVAQDGLLLLWSASDGSLVRRLPGHQGAVHAVAFSPDGLRVATASGDHTARLWDVPSGASRSLEGFDGGVTWLTFSPDGRSLLAGGLGGQARLWPLSPPRDRLLASHDGGTRAAFFAPDSAAVISVGEGGDVRWTPLRGGPPSSLKAAGRPAAAALSPDGRLLALIEDGDAIEQIPLDGARRPARGHHRLARRLVFLPDGKRLVSGAEDGSLLLWTALSDAPPRPLPPHRGRVASLAASPAGARVASGGADGLVRIWGEAESRELRGHAGSVDALAFSPDGKLLASGGADRTIRLWDTTTGQARVLEAGAGVRQLAFSHDGQRLLSLGGHAPIDVWDVATGKQGLPLRGHPGGTRGLDAAPDSARIISGGDDQRARIWDLASGESRLLEGHDRELRQVLFSPDGRLALSTDAGGAVRLWHDDLPTDPEQLRAWLDAATPETIR